MTERGDSRPYPVDVLQPMTFVVLASGTPEPLAEEQKAAPIACTTGVDGEPLAGFEAARGCQIWAMRWACGLEVLLALEPGDMPRFADFYEQVEDKRNRVLALMPAANRLAA